MSPATRECAKCAETVTQDELTCAYCGFKMPPHKSALLRLGEAASLAAVLAVIVLVCRFIGSLIAV